MLSTLHSSGLLAICILLVAGCDKDNGATGPAEIQLEMRVLLQAAYSEVTNNMIATLDVPLRHPYDSVGYNGTETLDTVNADIIDWVLVTVYDADMENIVHQEACVLRASGAVLSVDSSWIRFPVAASEYLITVHHRNHLDIRTLEPVRPAGGIMAVNFAARPGLARYPFDNGLYGMISGDVNGDQKIVFGSTADSDNLSMLFLIGGSYDVLQGYTRADVNFDGIGKYLGDNSDRIYLSSTVAVFDDVPGDGD